MKFTAPLYEGDSILRFGGNANPQVDSKSDFVHRITEREENVFKFPVYEIEAAARALRAAAIAQLAKALFRSLGERLERARQLRKEAELARVRTLAELEDRLRKLEHQGKLLHV